MNKFSRTATGAMITISVLFAACSSSYKITDISTREAKSFIAGWPAKPQEVANNRIDKYVPPNEVTANMLVWNNNGPWKRTIIFDQESKHIFPVDHTDVIVQVMDYKIPPNKSSNLITYDGSLIVERTKGEIGVRCDMEAANFIAINLMHEVITAKRTVEEARKEYGEAISAHLMNRPSPYAEGFTFSLPEGDTTDIDETKIAGAMLEQMGKKVKNALSGKD